mmetsp:Transcript_8180/g.19155  ORF Transcript_8180/g.19155 Transcript_8180/m.19155 type:complete len:208 (+) Transcript_8180:590-1213(+)
MSHRSLCPQVHGHAVVQAKPGEVALVAHRVHLSVDSCILIVSICHILHGALIPDRHQTLDLLQQVSRLCHLLLELVRLTHGRSQALQQRLHGRVRSQLGTLLLFYGNVRRHRSLSNNVFQAFAQDLRCDTPGVRHPMNRLFRCVVLELFLQGRKLLDQRCLAVHILAGLAELLLNILCLVRQRSDLVSEVLDGDVLLTTNDVEVAEV